VKNRVGGEFAHDEDGIIGAGVSGEDTRDRVPGVCDLPGSATERPGPFAGARGELLHSGSVPSACAWTDHVPGG
jgi:hypothetical protein